MQDEVDVVAGTFSKSLASVGGFVASTHNTIDYLKHHSRPFIFTASLPPANTAGVLAALEVLQQEPERREHLWSITRRLQDGLRGLGYDIGETKTPIVPGAHRPDGQDLPLLAEALRRRGLHQPGRGPRGAAVAVPAPDQPHRHPYPRPDRPGARPLRQDREGTGGHLTDVVVRRVETPGDLKRFIDLPYRMHARDPNWVPPLRMEVATLLDQKKNPFFAHGAADYFIAERGGQVVGRIAAIQNHLHNEVHEDKVGFFGFFECVDDQQVAKKLFEIAEDWIASKGLDTLRGPASFSLNDECGLLVDGFETPNVVLMPHNPPYYQRLIEGAGFTKAKDLLAYEGGTPTIRWTPRSGSSGQ